MPIAVINMMLKSKSFKIPMEELHGSSAVPGDNKGNWAADENLLYVIYLDLFKYIFSSRAKKK